MKYIAAALAILPTVALAACINDQTYTIGYASASYSCSDLELTSNEATRAYLCNASPATVTRCPHACGTCCEDSSFYKFDMINIIAEQPCSWISKNPKKIDIRRGNYCKDSYVSNTYVVKDMCQVACDNCYGTPAPTPHPTPLVTPAPTPAPTPPPANDGSPSSQPSIPPSTQPSPPQPTSKPSTSLLPSIVPSDEPSKHPTSSIKPSASPSSLPVAVPPTPSPTPNPTPGPTPAPVSCADGTGSFVIDSTGALKTCDWLVINNTTMEARKNDYCGRSTVANLCKSSCGYCSCTDSATYQWPLLNIFTSNLGSCAWLTKNTDPVKLANRKNRYCTYGFQKGNVSYNCPVACGTFTCA